MGGVLQLHKNNTWYIKKEDQRKEAVGVFEGLAILSEFWYETLN